MHIYHIDAHTTATGRLPSAFEPLSADSGCCTALAGCAPPPYDEPPRSADGDVDAGDVGRDVGDASGLLPIDRSE